MSEKSRNENARAESIRIRVLRLFSLWAILCTALTADTVDAENAIKRPNVVLMIADDMSWKDWGVYGDKFAKPPNIDKVADVELPADSIADGFAMHLD